MTIELTEHAQKLLKKLPENIQKKAEKAFVYLADDPHHPALNTRKMSGVKRFEARVDIHYRFTYLVEGDTIYILSVGQHDRGLGKK
jgi:mRNA-degrading endonuclease RelE of RelBE toxin-antitoxin system